MDDNSGRSGPELLGSEFITKELYDKIKNSDWEYRASTKTNDRGRDNYEFETICTVVFDKEVALTLKARGGAHDGYGADVVVISWDKMLPTGEAWRPYDIDKKAELATLLEDGNFDSSRDYGSLADAPVFVKLKEAMGVKSTTPAQILAAIISNAMPICDFLNLFDLDETWNVDLFEGEERVDRFLKEGEGKEHNAYWLAQQLLCGKKACDTKSDGKPPAKKSKTDPSSIEIIEIDSD